MEKYKNNLNQVKEMEEKHTKEILGENKLHTYEAACNQSQVELSVGELQARLKDALEKNIQWQSYNLERENYVTNLLSQFNQLNSQLNASNAKFEQLSKEKLQGHQKSHYDHLLAEAKQEINKLEKENFDLRKQVKNIRISYEKEIDEYSEMIEHWREKCNKQKFNEIKKNTNISTTKNKELSQTSKELHKLHNQLKEHINELRFDQDKEKYLVKENSKLKENNKVLEKKLEKFKKSRTSAEGNPKNQSNFRNTVENSPHLGDNKRLQKPLEKGSKPKKASSMIYSGRLSYQQERLHYDGTKSKRKNQSFDEQSLVTTTTATSCDDNDLLHCPNCNMKWPIREHRDLLKHIDECVR